MGIYGAWDEETWPTLRPCSTVGFTTPEEVSKWTRASHTSCSSSIPGAKSLGNHGIRSKIYDPSHLPPWHPILHLELLDQASRACRTVAPTFRLVPNRGNPWIFHMIPDAFLIPNTLWVFSESCGLSFRTNFLNCEFRIPCLHLFLKHHRSAASSFEKIWKAELLLFCMFLWWFLMILRFGSKNLQRVDSKNRRGSSQNDSRLWELCLTLQVWYCGVCFLWNQVNTQHSVIYIYIHCVYNIFISNHTKSTWNTM